MYAVVVQRASESTNNCAGFGDVGLIQTCGWVVIGDGPDVALRENYVQILPSATLQWSTKK